MKDIILIGTGNMAAEYAKVLASMNQHFTVIGRGIESAEVFKVRTGITAVTGGIQNYIAKNGVNKHTLAIIATGSESLMDCLLKLLDVGVEKVLIEKPAAISIEELLVNEEKLKPYCESIFIAYNRRFYASVIEAKRMIEDDGGLLSINFEFTEWAHKIESLVKEPGVKENWFFSNSTHVVDLAFFLAGKPKNWNAFSKTGKLSWHSKTNFVGAGITEQGVLFSYLSNWDSAGRWSIELLTEKRRIYLKPIESLGVQLKGTLPVTDLIFDDSLDTQFKPGLYNQMAAFLTNKKEGLLNMKEHLFNSRNIYSKMLA